MQGFEYPKQPHRRRHAPVGYRDYESYRDWLRDEFHFRCVYCLHREQWYDRGTTFHIDHLVPVAANPLAELEYTNLLYACATCNNAKRDILGVPDPCDVAFAECIAIQNDGQIRAFNEAGRALIRKLKLNNSKNIQYRYRWMRILSALRTKDPGLYLEFMGFPDGLPDLRRKNAPKNLRPESVEDCYFAMRERGRASAY